MRKILVALALLLVSSVAHAQTFTKPPNALTGVVPGYNMTIGIWAVDNPVIMNTYVYVFMLQGSAWVPVSNTSFVGGLDDGNLPGDIVAAGGVRPYVISRLLPGLNAILAAAFPPMGSAPPPVSGAAPVDQINAELATDIILTEPAGVPVLTQR